MKTSTRTSNSISHVTVYSIGITFNKKIQELIHNGMLHIHHTESLEFKVELKVKLFFFYSFWIEYGRVTNPVNFLFFGFFFAICIGEITFTSYPVAKQEVKENSSKVMESLVDMRVSPLEDSPSTTVLVTTQNLGFYLFTYFFDDT